MENNQTEEPRQGPSWKQWLMIVGGICVIGMVFIAIANALPYMHTFAPALATSIMLTVIIGIPGGLLLTAFGVIYWLHTSSQNKKIAARRFAANAHNVFPAYLDTRQGRFIQAINGELPHVVPEHYAPHTVYSVKDSSRSELAKPEEPLLLPAPTLPEQLDLSHLLETWQPDGRNILLGLLPGGEQIAVPHKSLCHVALAGATGGGKSTLMRLLFAQLLLSGCSVMLADPHYASVDPENGEDWRPIARRLSLEPAVSYTAIEDMLNWLAYEELKKRLDLRRDGQPVGEPIFLGMDELPDIVDNVPGAAAAMVKLLRQGRKLNVFLVSAAQDWLVKTIGLKGSGAVRDCFRTAFYVGGDTSSARTLLDVTGRVDDGGLGKGIVMVRSVATPQASLARVPSVSNEALYALLPASKGLSKGFPTSFQSPSTEELLEAPEKGTLPALDARSYRIRELLLARTKAPQIIKEIWNVSGGTAYQKASEELAERIATLLERGDL